MSHSEPEDDDIMVHNGDSNPDMVTKSFRLGNNEVGVAKFSFFLFLQTGKHLTSRTPSAPALTREKREEKKREKREEKKKKEKKREEREEEKRDGVRVKVYT